MNTDNGYNNTEYLVDKYINDVIRLALVYVRNYEDAQDIAQQVFITYIQKSPVFDSDAHAKNWLNKVAVNISRNYLRTKRSEVNFDDLEGVLFTDMSAFDVQTDKEERVFRAVMSLKRAYREVIHLYYYDGYDTNEIAKLLGIPSASVRTRLVRARTLLKETLEGGESFEGTLQECNESNTGG